MHATGNLDMCNVEISMLRTLKLAVGVDAHARDASSAHRILEVLEFLG